MLKVDANLAQELMKLKEELEKGDKKFLNDEYVINEKIIPLAKKHGFNFTADEFIAYTNDQLKELSEEDLLNISGGVGFWGAVGRVFFSVINSLNPFGYFAGSSMSSNLVKPPQALVESDDDLNAQYEDKEKGWFDFTDNNSGSNSNYNKNFYTRTTDSAVARPVPIDPEIESRAMEDSTKVLDDEEYHNMYNAFADKFPLLFLEIEDRMKDVIDGTEAEKSVIQKDLDIVKQEKETLQGEMEQVQAELQKKEEEIKSLKEEHEKYKEKLREKVNERGVQLWQKLKAAEQEKGKLKVEVEQVQAELQKSKEEIKSLKEEYEKIIEDLKKELEAAEQEKETLQGEIEQAQAELQKREEDIELLKELYVKEEKKADAAEQEKEELKVEVEQVQAKLQKSEEEIKSLKEKYEKIIEDLDEKLEPAEQVKEKLIQAELKTKEAEINSLQGKVEQVQAELQKREKENGKTIGGLKKELEAAVKEKGKLRTESEVSKKANRKYMEEIKAFNNKLTEKDEEIVSLRNVMKENEEKDKDKDKEIVSLKAELSKKSEEADSLRKIMDKVEIKIREALPISQKREKFYRDTIKKLNSKRMLRYEEIKKDSKLKYQVNHLNKFLFRAGYNINRFVKSDREKLIEDIKHVGSQIKKEKSGELYLQGSFLRYSAEEAMVDQEDLNKLYDLYSKLN